MSHVWTPREKIVKARIDFLQKDASFFGNLAIRLKLVECYWLPTAGVDGYHLYYNPDFIDRLTVEETKFVVAHEVMHCVYEHFLRRESRDARLWNCAGDYVINLELRDLSIGSIPNNSKFIDPEWSKKYPKEAKKVAAEPMCLIDDKFRNMGSEEVYDILKKDEEGGKGRKGDAFDSHIEPGQGNAEGDEEGKEGPVPLTDEQKARLSDDLKRAVMDAAKTAEEQDGGAGKVPMGVKRLIEEWTKSVIDWRDLLTRTIQSVLRSDYTWQRPSRKSQHSGCYLPGMANDQLARVHIAIDTSGSISHGMLRDFLGEVNGIMEQFSDFELWVWCFDTATYTVHKYGPDNLGDLAEFEMEGGGGTDFLANWEMMKESDIVPDQFVMFTDGYPWNSWGDPEYCETLFVIHGSDTIEAPFGLSVYYDKEKEGTTGKGAFK
jgi:predicted metal-dependent peptidase